MQEIVLTQHDREKLEQLIEECLWQDSLDKDLLQQLKSEIARATIVPPNKIPPDVVTMNSKVRLRDIWGKTRATYTLVYPDQANLKERKISVLAPVGTAILGRHVGDVVEWVVPEGVKHFAVEAVLFQPEASGMPDL